MHNPTDPVGRLPFKVLAMVAESEADLARMRTREGVKAGKAEGWPRGEQPKLAPGRKPTLWGCLAPANTPSVSPPAARRPGSQSLSLFEGPVRGREEGDCRGCAMK